MTDAKGKIAWRDWGPRAFQEAKEHDKPILLRLSAVWCHWCHVMDATSDKEPRAIELLNERFVPIRVDIDKMPDVRERYNFGGYPTSAFLTPSGDILTGGTYIPPEQFVELLGVVSDAYKQRKQEILKQIDEHRAHHRRPAPPTADGDPKTIADHLVEDTQAAILALFDPEHGGFGSQPKFPHGAATEFALRSAVDTGRKEFDTVARRTLDAMRDSAMWDTEEQGFFRYCVRPDWSEPHYEKMLETNAALLRAYSVAYGTWGRSQDLAIMQGIRTYVDRTLRDPETGLFHGSQDADEAYYGKTLRERAALKAPFVDRTSYTDWTAQMADAYLQAFHATADASWLDSGRTTVDSLLQRAFDPANGFYHYVRDGKKERTGILSDQAHGATVLIRLYELTGDPRYLDAAIVAANVARRTMWDPQRLLYNDKAPQKDDLGLLATPHASVVENGVMAHVLERLAFHRPADPFARQLEELVRGHQGAAEKYGIFSSELALAVQRWRRPRLEIHVAGPLRATAPAIREAAQVHAVGATLLRSDGPWPGADERLGKKPPVPSVFFCSESACSRLYRPDEAFAADALKMLGLNGR